jgi:hypothetical protein
VRSRQIDYGDVPETRHDVVVVLTSDGSEGIAEQENVYVLRRYSDGQICNGHIHDSVDVAPSCVTRGELDPPWSDLLRATAEISMRRIR